MRTLLKQAIESIREDLGDPVSLRRVLAAYPCMRLVLDDPVTCIHVSSVPRWHELGEFLGWPRHPRGYLRGWHVTGGRWQSFDVTRPEFTQIAHHKVEQNWHCDVVDIDGFSASKADLWAFSSTDAMAEARCQSLIAKVTPEQLARNLAHREIRIIHSPGSDYFARYLWDGRLWLINDGGSHHTAAARVEQLLDGQRVEQGVGR